MDAGDSAQISQSQSAVVGDGIFVNETSPESLENAGGSGQNCGSQSNKKIDALQADDEDSCFLARSGESSEEFEFTEEDDVAERKKDGVAEGKKKQKLDLHSSSRKKLPLRTKTREVGEKSDQQLLYHCGFTMLI